MERAALSLVASSLSPVISNLSNKAASYFGGDITPKELDNLQTVILPKIQTVMQEANKIDVVTLKPWLLKLKASAYEAEDILDMYVYEKIKNKVSSLHTSLKKVKGKAREVLAPILLKTELRKSLEKLQQSANEADQLIQLLHLVSLNSGMQRDPMGKQHTTVSGLSSPVFGRDEECSALINMLITEPHESSSKKNVIVHAIYGIGGAGKTTLAQYIYKDERVENHFNLKIWVHVSRTFDMYRITKETIESVVKGPLEEGTSSVDIKQAGISSVDNLNVLQKILMKNLKSKRFLLVLDDIWCEERELWDRLLIPLDEVGEVGSRILITTRMERVALKLGIKSTISLKELKTDDCWSIVRHYAFGDARKDVEDPDLQHVGKQIVTGLKNSPLAARIVGSSLAQKVSVDEWKMFLKGDMLKETMDALYLSFQSLSPNLQRCFAYCSLYPKGFKFDIGKLVMLWIAQGFIEASSNCQLTIEERGKQHFNDLLSYSFFQPIDGENLYVMHDLLHDLAEEVAKNHCLRIVGEKPVTISAEIIHLSIMGDTLDVHISNILKLVNLRTLIIFSKSSFGLDKITNDAKKIFEKLTKLRALLLGNYSILEFRCSELKHLRYLQLYEVKKYPISLDKMYHLQFLDLSRHFTNRAPRGLNNLVNLRSLHGHGDVIFSNISNIGKLTSLQRLNVYYPKRGHAIGQLKNLSELHGSLELKVLENVKDEVEAVEAMLKDKMHLEKLRLDWSNSSEVNCRAEEEVLKGLEPHTNLEQLEISCYKGAKSPGWMVNDQYCLPNLQSLKLLCCPNLMGLPCLPRCLKELHIWECSNLTEVPSLPHSLRKLDVYNCPKLMQLSPFPCKLQKLDMENCTGTEMVNNQYCLPNLQSVKLLCCPNLMGFSCLPLYLKELHISECYNLVEAPFLPHSLSKLEVYNCPKLMQLFPFPHKLQKLDMENCPGIATLLSSLLRKQHQRGKDHHEPLSLKELNIYDCSLLDENTLNKSLQKFESLSKLTLWKLPSIRSFHLGPYLSALKDLVIEDCENLRCIKHNILGYQEFTRTGDLQPLDFLKKLKIIDCPNFTAGVGRERAGSLPSIHGKLTIDEPLLLILLFQEQSLNSLQELEIYRCSHDIPFGDELEDVFQHLSSLKSLSFKCCNYLPSLPMNLEKLSSLKHLEIMDCPKMESLPNLPATLESLKMWRCLKTETLPTMPPSLQLLNINNCHPQLEVQYGKGGPLQQKVKHIPCTSIC